MEWKLMGQDAFDGSWYYITTDPYKPSYNSYREALAAARERLFELENYQPSQRSGGQAGIQDRVYLKHPDGVLERILL